MLLFDCEQKRGKTLFTNRGVVDVFNFVLEEVLTSYNTVKCYVGETVGELPAEHVAYIEQCLRFLFFSYVFYQDEKVVRDVFDKIRAYVSAKSEEKCEKFEMLLNALTFFCGFGPLRRNSIRVLHLIIFGPFWLKVKTSKL